MTGSTLNFSPSEDTTPIAPLAVHQITVIGRSEGSGRDCNLAPAGVGLKGQIVDEGRSSHERLAAAGTPVTFTSTDALNAAEGHDPACPLQTPCAQTTSKQCDPNVHSYRLACSFAERTDSVPTQAFPSQWPA